MIYETVVGPKLWPICTTEMELYLVRSFVTCQIRDGHIVALVRDLIAPHQLDCTRSGKTGIAAAFSMPGDA